MPDRCPEWFSKPTTLKNCFVFPIRTPCSDYLSPQWADKWAKSNAVWTGKQGEVRGGKQLAERAESGSEVQTGCDKWKQPQQACPFLHTEPLGAVRVEVLCGAGGSLENHVLSPSRQSPASSTCLLFPFFIWTFTCCPTVAPHYQVSNKYFGREEAFPLGHIYMCCGISEQIASCLCQFPATAHTRIFKTSQFS